MNTVNPDDDTTTYDSEAADAHEPEPFDLDDRAPPPDAVVAGGAWLFVVGALVFIGAAVWAAVGAPL
jgi:hypothetical protein